MKHEFRVLSKEEVLANRSNAYEFINFNKQNMKLISMTEFVLERKKKMENDAQNHVIFSTSGNLTKIFKYAEFLKQPLKLEMFVPCDEDGNFLEEPIDSIGGVELYTKKYQQAKDEVLFEDFNFFESQIEATNTMLGDYGIFTFINRFGFITHTKGQGYSVYYKLNTIEDLIRIEKGISLTESAIKQLWL